MYKCPNCKKEFKTRDQLLIHLIRNQECRNEACRILAQHDLDMSHLVGSEK